MSPNPGSLFHLSDQLTFSVGAMLAAVGIYLQWRRADFTMQAEEYVKDGRLSEVQGRRRVAMLSFLAPVAMSVGLLACGIVVWS